MRLKKIAKSIAGISALLVVAGTVIFVISYPAVVAPACPRDQRSLAG